MKCFHPVERKHREGYFDLHLHSNRNGGLISPREIALEIYKLYRRGKFLEKVSLTDHETLDGQQEFLDMIGVLDFGEHRPVVYFGVEVPLILDLNDRTVIHVLAYSSSRNTTLFSLRKRSDYIFERINASMHTRSVLKAKRLICSAGDSCPITMDNVYAHARFGKYVSDISIIKALQTSGAFESEREIQEFLNQFNTSFEGPVDPSFWPKANEVIPSLARCFDYVSWAHPFRNNSHRTLDEIISQLVNLRGGGINTLEAYHPSHSSEETAEVVSLSRKFGLYLSGGSDTHFYKKPPLIGISLEDVDKSRLI